MSLQMKHVEEGTPQHAIVIKHPHGEERAPCTTQWLQRGYRKTDSQIVAPTAMSAGCVPGPLFPTFFRPPAALLSPRGLA